MIIIGYNYDVTSILCKVLQSNMLLLRITVLDTVTRQTITSLCSFFCRTWKFDQRWSHIYSCTHTTISWLQFARGEMKAWSAVSEERRYQHYSDFYCSTGQEDKSQTGHRLLESVFRDSRPTQSEDVWCQHWAAMSIRPAALWPPVLQQKELCECYCCVQSQTVKESVCVCVCVSSLE